MHHLQQAINGAEMTLNSYDYVNRRKRHILSRRFRKTLTSNNALLKTCAEYEQNLSRTQITVDNDKDIMSNTMNSC